MHRLNLNNLSETYFYAFLFNNGIYLGGGVIKKNITSTFKDPLLLIIDEVSSNICNGHLQSKFV